MPDLYGDTEHEKVYIDQIIETAVDLFAASEEFLFAENKVCYTSVRIMCNG